MRCEKCGSTYKVRKSRLDVGLKRRACGCNYLCEPCRVEALWKLNNK